MKDTILNRLLFKKRHRCFYGNWSWRKDNTFGNIILSIEDIPAYHFPFKEEKRFFKEGDVIPIETKIFFTDSPLAFRKKISPLVRLKNPWLLYCFLKDITSLPSNDWEIPLQLEKALSRPDVIKINDEYLIYDPDFEVYQLYGIYLGMNEALPKENHSELLAEIHPNLDMTIFPAKAGDMLWTSREGKEFDDRILQARIIVKLIEKNSDGLLKDLDFLKTLCDPFFHKGIGIIYEDVKRNQFSHALVDLASSVLLEKPKTLK